MLASYTNVGNSRGQTNCKCLGSQEEYSRPFISKCTPQKKVRKRKESKKARWRQWGKAWKWMFVKVVDLSNSAYSIWPQNVWNSIQIAFSKYYHKRFMNIWKIWWNVCSNSVHRLYCHWYKEVKQLEKLYDSVKQRTQAFILKRQEKERKGKERGGRVAECEKNITLACYYIINVIILFHIYHLYILK